MLLATWGTALNILVFAALVAAVIYLFVLIVRALKKYIGSKEMREEKQAVKRTLGETLKAHRTRCQMTQEFEEMCIRDRYGSGCLPGTPTFFTGYSPLK